MNTSVIEDLLARFYEGNTTLEEEQALREFFRRMDVPAHLKSHQQMFTYFSDKSCEEQNDPGFEQKMTLLLTGKTEPDVVRMNPARIRLRYVLSIAATILLMVGIFITFQYEVRQSGKMAGKVDLEIAYSNVNEALLLVSGNLNCGMKQAEKLQMIDKAIFQLEYFNKFYQYESKIFNPDLIMNQSIKSKQP